MGEKERERVHKFMKRMEQVDDILDRFSCTRQIMTGFNDQPSYKTFSIIYIVLLVTYMKPTECFAHTVYIEKLANFFVTENRLVRRPCRRWLVIM
jgi:hypothetical protein